MLMPEATTERVNRPTPGRREDLRDFRVFEERFFEANRTDLRLAARGWRRPALVLRMIFRDERMSFLSMVV